MIGDNWYHIQDRNHGMAWWIGDIKNPDICEEQPVENKVTGKIELQTSVWVKVGNLTKEQYENASSSKSGSKQMVTDKVTSAVMKNISQRIGNYVAGR